MSFLSRFAFLIAVSPFAYANDMVGARFSHHDWELACDNTRTCRAAGYHNDSDEHAISVLLTRKAGSGEPVTGKVMIGNYDEDQELKNLPSQFTLTLSIDKRDIGKIVIESNSLVADLNNDQVSALLKALRRSSNIEFSTRNIRWHLSDKGSAAVLLKMDEFQGRLDTPGALFKRGNKSEADVLPPLPIPVVTHVPPHKAMSGDAQFVKKNLKALIAAIRNADPELGCEPLYSGSETTDTPKLESLRLSDTKMLVYGMCWMAAYNFGYGYWVVNDTPPFDALLITTSGDNAPSTLADISESQKGRGLGDCWSSEQWTWDGKQYIHTDSSSSGMCKLVAPGGAWNLPTIVTKVR